jgi:protein-S-isoprenylcysteine O-methyltransferase Ste14
MNLLVAKLIWFLGVAGWFIIRYPHDRRSRKTPRAQRPDRVRELVLLTISFSGMFVVPAIYVLTDEPKFATYELQPLLTVLGTGVFCCALWMFHRTHKDLGRNWSVTLEVRVGHSLITNGVYQRVRHPMYTAFFLWAIAQALLLPNWIAGFAGLLGFGTLFAFRVGREERMMLETFGDQYRQYAARTKRIIPGVF